MPCTWSAPMIPETPTTGAAVATRASRMPGTPRIVPTETTGLDGGTSTRSASLIASSTPGAGLGLLDADRHDRVGRDLGTVADPVLLEVHGLAFPGLRVVDDDVRLDAVVGHRQQLDPPPDGESQRRHRAAVTALSG